MDEKAFEVLAKAIEDIEGRLLFIERVFTPVLAAMPLHTKTAAQADAEVTFERLRATMPRGAAESYALRLRKIFGSDRT